MFIAIILRSFFRSAACSCGIVKEYIQFQGHCLKYLWGLDLGDFTLILGILFAFFGFYNKQIHFGSFEPGNPTPKYAHVQFVVKHGNMNSFDFSVCCSALNICNVDLLLKIGTLLPEIVVYEKYIDTFIELIRKDQVSALHGFRS